VANLLATESEVMQQLLQSQSTSFRLLGLKRILEEAVSELGSLMLDDGMLTEEELDTIKQASYHPDDDDSDLMPPDDFEGVTLASELDPELIAELGISESSFVDFSTSERSTISSTGLWSPMIDEMVTMKETETETDVKKKTGNADSSLRSSNSEKLSDFDAMWESASDAFQ
jgi:hypothetical protein